MDMYRLCVLTICSLLVIVCGTSGARLSNSKLVPPDGILCGAGKMGFKFSKAELISRFRAMADNHAKDPVEVVQIYVAGSKLEALCLYDPDQVEDRKSINAAVAEFDDGERGINITASGPVIWLGNWIPYFATDSRGEPCVSSVKADTIVYFQSEVVIEVVAPITQAGAKMKLTIHCEMPRPQNIDTDLKVNRVDHIGSAVGEIPFQETILLKFVHPSDPTLAVTEVGLDEPVRLVLWKVRQESDQTTLRTSIIPIHCELYSDSEKSTGITFVQNSCQAKTPADIVTAVMSKRTDVDGLEFREVFWADLKGFRFDGSTSLLASCAVRICSRSHLTDCQNMLGSNGLPCFDEGDPKEMQEYPAITGENSGDVKGPEQPNQELELLRLSYPRKYIPFDSQRTRRGVPADEGDFVTIKERLKVVPAHLSSTRHEIRTRHNSAYRGNNTSVDVWQPAERSTGLQSNLKSETCFQNSVIYIALGIMGWLLLFALVIISLLTCYIRRQKRKTLRKDQLLDQYLSGSSVASYSTNQPVRY